jgi:hypothetical protein
MVLVGIKEEDGRRGGFHLKEEWHGESMRLERPALSVLRLWVVYRNALLVLTSTWMGGG